MKLRIQNMANLTGQKFAEVAIQTLGACFSLFPDKSTALVALTTFPLELWNSLLFKGILATRHRGLYPWPSSVRIELLISNAGPRRLDFSLFTSYFSPLRDS
jgi:hypothetical protein